MPSGEWNDEFNRADSDTVGEGWSETEGAAGDAKIASNNVRLTHGSASPIVINKTSLTPTDLSRLDFRFKSADGTAEVGVYIRGGGNHVMLTSILNGKIRHHTGGGWVDTTDGTYTNDTYVVVSLRNINFSAKTYDIWLDGSEKETSVSFSNTSQGSADQKHYRVDNAGAILDVDWTRLDGIEPSTSNPNSQMMAANF